MENISSTRQMGKCSFEMKGKTEENETFQQNKKHRKQNQNGNIKRHMRKGLLERKKLRKASKMYTTFFTLLKIGVKSEKKKENR